MPDSETSFLNWPALSKASGRGAICAPTVLKRDEVADNLDLETARVADPLYEATDCIVLVRQQVSNVADLAIGKRNERDCLLSLLCYRIGFRA